jgi:hypothetical protein
MGKKKPEPSDPARREAFLRKIRDIKRKRKQQGK